MTIGPLIAALRSRIKDLIQTLHTHSKQPAKISRITRLMVFSLGKRLSYGLPIWKTRLISLTETLRSLTVHLSRLRYGQVYFGLMAIVGFVLIGNEANRRVLAAPSVWDRALAQVSPDDVLNILSAVDPLTPEMSEQPEVVASHLLATEELFLSRPESALMSEAAVLSKKDPIPYTVQQGDTLVGIAKEHDRTVATVLEANQIPPEQAWQIKPGITLLIPQEDTSDSLAWLEAEQSARAEAERKRQLELAKRAASRRQLARAAETTERAAGGFGGAAVGGFIVPVNHNGISRGLSSYHAGIDYRADTGSTVVAAAEGRVIEITRGWAGGFGISVLVDHGQGQTSRYAHLSGTAVSIGSSVSQGQVIAYSGNTGRSTGPHLHFEVRSSGRAIYPF